MKIGISQSEQNITGEIISRDNEGGWFCILCSKKQIFNLKLEISTKLRFKYLSFLIVSVLALSFAWRELFSSDKRHQRLYFFPGWEKWVIICHFEKPIWPPNGNKNRNREYVIENLPHEAPGAPKIQHYKA